MCSKEQRCCFGTEPNRIPKTIFLARIFFATSSFHQAVIPETIFFPMHFLFLERVASIDILIDIIDIYYSWMSMVATAVDAAAILFFNFKLFRDVERFPMSHSTEYQVGIGSRGRGRARVE